MRRPLFMACLCLVFLAALRLWIYDIYDTGGGQRLLPTPVDGEIITVTGRVSRKDAQSFILDSVELSSELQAESKSEMLSYTADSRQMIPMNENLICEYEDTDSVLMGSTVVLRGEFRLFRNATNPGEFDVLEYYHSLRVGGKLTDVTVLASGSEYSRWRETLYQLRSYFKNRLYSVFPQKEASVLTAMLLGDKEELDSGIEELYMQNGIIHILSISGLHITMIGLSIYQMLRRAGVPVWLAAICGGSILCLYGVMTGMSVSACRAIGMYLIRLLSQVVGRTYDLLTALGIMAALMVWQNPENLNNAGFLLSFGSILGIGWFYPALLPKNRKSAPKRYESIRWKRILGQIIREWRQRLGQSMLASGSITLFTLPIQLWFYYEVPVYSLFINLLILPFMSLLMTTGLVTMLLPGTGIIGTITCLILQVYEWLCECFDRLPLHTWNPGKPDGWQVVVYYLILFCVVVLRERKSTIIGGRKGILSEEKRMGRLREPLGKDKLFGRYYQMKSGKQTRENCCYVWIFSVLTLAVIVLTLHIRTETTVTFLDVGQGDGIVMETSSGEVFLFDCGSTGRSQVGEYVLLPFLKYNGIRHIDAVFVSHPDMDHSSGIVELLGFAEEEGITVGQLVLPDIAESLREEEFDSLWQAAENAGIGAEDMMLGEERSAEQKWSAGQKRSAGQKWSAGQKSSAEQKWVTEQGKSVPISYMNAGDTFETQGASFLCLHPPEDYENEDSNAYSQCLYVEMVEGGFSLLLTGDVEGEGEELLRQELQSRDIEDVTVLKVPHHGSRNSSGEAFLQQVQPRVAVISCGRNNSYGHPHGETLERLEAVGSTILTTPECGAITVEIGEEVRVRSWLNPD